jgi:hypothetical protein
MLNLTERSLSEIGRVSSQFRSGWIRLPLVNLFYLKTTSGNLQSDNTPNQPVQKEYSAKAVTVSSKEKDSQNPQVLIRNHFPKTKEILKPSSSFNFENDIHKIKIHIPFLELINNEEFKKYLSKML